MLRLPLSQVIKVTNRRINPNIVGDNNNDSMNIEIDDCNENNPENNNLSTKKILSKLITTTDDDNNIEQLEIYIKKDIDYPNTTIADFLEPIVPLLLTVNKHEYVLQFYNFYPYTGKE